MLFGTKKLIAGVAGGLAGGVVFGMMMASMGMLPMIGKMVGSATATAGWVVHLMMGMGLGVNWNAAAATEMLPSLMGHLMFGTVLGVVYHPLLQRLARVRPTAARVDREAEATA